jgi:hypothetical protein
MTKQERQEKIDQFGNAYAALAKTVKSLTKEEMNFKPAPDKWSAHEIVVHIADAEANSYTRLKRALAESGSMVMAYDQDTWAKELNYAAQNLEDNLELFRLLRKLSLETINTMPEEKWANQYNHSDYGMVGLESWLKIYAGHVSGHIGQIERNMEAFKGRK